MSSDAVSPRRTTAAGFIAAGSGTPAVRRRVGPGARPDSSAVSVGPTSVVAALAEPIPARDTESPRVGALEMLAVTGPAVRCPQSVRKPAADMIGTIDFNCYYRYANLDQAQLLQNLGGDEDLARRASGAWLNAFIHAVPSGKQNSMAARTLPSTLLGVVREHGAWNLANAFLNPIIDHDLLAASTAAPTNHLRQHRTFYGDSGIHTIVAASLTGELPHTDAGDMVGTIGEFTDRLLSPVGT